VLKYLKLSAGIWESLCSLIQGPRTGIITLAFTYLIFVLRNNVADRKWTLLYLLFTNSRWLLVVAMVV